MFFSGLPKGGCGYIKFTLRRAEVCGVFARVDCISYFKHKINELGLVDLELVKLMPTLRSNKVGEVGV